MSKEELKLELLSGIGPKIGNKWRLEGYKNLRNIANASSQQLVRDLGLNVGKAQSIIAEANRIVAEESIVFETGEDILKYREEVVQRISTGAKNFDKILGGGIQSDASTLLTGSYGAGKTQVVQQLCVNCVVDLKKVAIFLSTEQATFVPERFVAMAVFGKNYVPYGWKPDKLAKVLNRSLFGQYKEITEEQAENIILNANGTFYFGEGKSDIVVVRPKYLQTSDKLYNALEGIETDLIKARGMEIGLIVVDSYTGLLRGEFLGRATLSERSEAISRHIKLINRLTSKYGIAFVATGQVYGVPDPRQQGSLATRRTGMTHIPWGGDRFLHFWTYQISLDQVSGGKSTELVWEAYTYDAPTPRQTARFIICREGVRDAEY